MSFTFYGYLDQAWIDNKQSEYNICNSEIIELVEDYGYEAKHIMENANPVINCLINLIIQQLLDKLENHYSFSDELLEKIREGLYETVFINCIDSHLGGEQVYDSLEGEIIEMLEESEDMERVEKLKNIFLEYDF